MPRMLASSTYPQASMNVTNIGYGGGLPRPASTPEMSHLATRCGSPASTFSSAGLPRPSSAPDMTCLGHTSSSSASTYLEASSGIPSPQRLFSNAESDAGACPAHSRKSWRVVWCHERCHKPDNEGRREELDEVTGTAGASLVCLKKASKYGDWLRRGQRPAYILLTDWREVKPCLGIASQAALSNQPTFTVVLCEEQCQFHRAQAWAEALPRRADPVHVCKDLNFLKAFLNKYSERAASGPLAHQQNLQPDCLDSSFLLAPGPQVQQSLQVPWRQTTGAVMLPTTMAHAVAALPQPMIPPGMSPSQLESVLLAAAPDTYED